MDTTAFKDPNLPALPREEAIRLRDNIFRSLGNNIRTWLKVMDLLSNVGITIKTTKGYYVYKNRYAIESSNLGNDDSFLGKRAQDIYPPRTWHIYVEREAKVLETGIPFVNQVYGFASDLTDNLSSSSGFPLQDGRGRTVALLTMFKRASSESQAPAWHDQMQPVITYINSHAGEILKVSDLARKANLSLTRFIRLFAAVTGETPNQYISKVRINSAKVLLETTKKPIIEIVSETGFFDQPHFSRTFKRITGLTPAKYRKQHWAI